MKRLLVIATAAVLVVTMVSPALAERSLVTIHKDPTFHGAVHSDKAKCKQHRLVRVYRQKPGHNERIGHDYTNGRGRYLVKVDHPTPGNYYAVAAKKGDCFKVQSERTLPVS